MGWKKALLHAGIAAGAAFFAALTTAYSDSLLTVQNLVVAGIATGVALFASLGASYAAGEFDSVGATA